MALVPVPPLVTQISTLDQEMSNILENKQLSTDVKFHRYQDALQRYKIMSTDREVPKKEESKTALPNLLRDIPTQKKRKAKILYEFLETLPEFGINDKNEIIIGDHVIGNSNIVDVFADLALDRRTNELPRGSQQLVTHLKKHNVPLEAIGNASRRELFEEPVVRVRRNRGSGLLWEDI